MDKIKEELQRLDIELGININSLRNDYAIKSRAIRKQCEHKHDNGNSSLVLVGKPFHLGWDECAICGTLIESNEYGTIERSDV